MRKLGFTIVELLIVIVVIAILAAISIVAYNGVQQRARASALADGSVKLEKAFRLTATQEGWSTWPVYGNNPTIAALISSTEMKNYLQKHRPYLEWWTPTGYMITMPMLEVAARLARVG